MKKLILASLVLAFPSTVARVETTRIPMKRGLNVIGEDEGLHGL
jgi:hypothetical protein